MKLGGNCKNGACYWFSQIAEIPGEPTLNDAKYRTVNVNVSSGDSDWSRKNPWRAPGSAPVHGSGCGTAGGGPIPYDGTGANAGAYAQGADALAVLPKMEPTVWKAGSVQEVAQGISANHNGGYSWRLCKNDAKNDAKKGARRAEPQQATCTSDPTCTKTNPLQPEAGPGYCKQCSDTSTGAPAWSCDVCCDGCMKVEKFKGAYCNCTGAPTPTPPPAPLNPDVNEKCFQNNVLKFASSSSWIEWTNGTRLEFPLTKVTEGTFPAGSEWARSPIPGCHICDRHTKCGPNVEPTGPHDKAFSQQAFCSAICDGASASKATGECPAGTEWYPALAGLSGYGKYQWPWSIVDKVVVPEDLEAGEYLLSWRWDCEETSQVWQNCADIRIEA